MIFLQIFEKIREDIYSTCTSISNLRGVCSTFVPLLSCFWCYLATYSILDRLKWGWYRQCQRPSSAIYPLLGDFKGTSFFPSIIMASVRLAGVEWTK